MVRCTTIVMVILLELLQQAQYHAQLLPPEAPAKRLIKLVMHSERQGDHAVELEPLYVSDSDTMADIEARIQVTCVRILL